VIQVRRWPVEAGSIVKNLYLDNLFRRSTFEPFEIFAGDQTPMAIAQFENQDVQFGTRFALHFSDPWLGFEILSVVQRLVAFGVRGDDLMRCHLFPLTRLVGRSKLCAGDR
jgi:hypothetical protein